MTEIVDDKSLNAELARLDAAGNGSKRFGYLAKLIRRLTWRIFRPYHAHNLSLVVALQERNQRLEEALTRIQTAAEGLQWQVDHLKEGQVKSQGISDGLQWQLDHLKIAQEQGKASADGLQWQIDHLKIAQEQGQTSADGLQWQIDHLKIAEAQGKTSADGLQWQINEINGRFHGVNAHLDETRALYGHLADEMPKFVAPILELKRELAEADNRARRATEDVDAVLQELRVLGQRITGIESGMEPATLLEGLKPDINTLSERIQGLQGQMHDVNGRFTGVNAHLDETRARYDDLANEINSRFHGVNAHLDETRALYGNLANEVSGRFHGVNAHIDETRALYGHLADEMPKFVAPILDFKRELGEADNRSRQAAEVIEAVLQELRVLAQRVSGMENGPDPVALIQGLKPDIASLSERIETLQGQVEQLKLEQAHDHISAEGLQGQIHEINQRFHGVNAHLDETRALYGHLADEMPKFVAPVLEFKRELADADSKARQALVDVDATMQELRALAKRVSGIENGPDPIEAVEALKPGITAIHQQLDGLGARLDETRELYTQLSDDFELTKKESTTTADRISALEAIEPDNTAIEELHARIDNMKSLLEETRETIEGAALEALKPDITAIHQKLDGLDVRVDETRELYSQLTSDIESAKKENTTAVDRINALEAIEPAPREDLNAVREEASAAALALESKLANFETLTQRLGDLESIISPLSNSDRIPLSERLLEMSDKISDVEAKLRDLGQQTETLHTDHSTTQLTLAQIDELKSRLVELGTDLAQIRAENEGVSDQIRAVGEETRTATELAENATEIARSASNSSPYFMANTDDGIFLFKSGDLIAKVVAETGRWDSHIIALMDDLIKTRAGVAIDVGAHVGTMTMAMAHRFKEVHSFEPNDFTFKMLSANVALNNVKNVTLHNYPLFSKSLKMSLAAEDMQEGPLPFDRDGHFIKQDKVNLGGLSFSEKGTDAFTHTARTLDSLNITGVDFLKIDAQGADGEVLMGALETINTCRPVVVFEWEEHLSKNYSCDLDKVRVKLAKIGYSLQVLYSHNDKQSDYVAYSLK